MPKISNNLLSEKMKEVKKLSSVPKTLKVSFDLSSGLNLLKQSVELGIKTYSNSLASS